MTVRRSDGRTVGRIAAAVVLLSVGPTVRPSTAQCPDGSPPPCRAARTDPGRQPGVPTNSVAVLYFDNLSRDTTDAYLAEGLTEELIAQLRRVERLVVKSRNAVRRYRAAELDPEQLGRWRASPMPRRGRCIGGRSRKTHRPTAPWRAAWPPPMARCTKTPPRRTPGWRPRSCSATAIPAQPSRHERQSSEP